MNRNLKKLAGGVLAGLTVLVVLAACAGASGSANPTSAAPQATPTATPKPPSATATATAASVPTPVPPTQTAVSQSTPTPIAASGTGGGDLLALGKEVFEKKAGNIGCQACHGMDAKGVVGPNIRGKTEADIRRALKEVDLMMQNVKNLDDRDIEAVAAYLQFMTTQP